MLGRDQVDALVPAAVASDGDKAVAKWWDDNAAAAASLVDSVRRSSAQATLKGLLKGLTPEEVQALLNSL